MRMSMFECDLRACVRVHARVFTQQTRGDGGDDRRPPTQPWSHHAAPPGAGCGHAGIDAATARERGEFAVTLYYRVVQFTSHARS